MIGASLVRFLKAALPARGWLMIRGFATAIVTPFAFSLRTGHWRSSLTGKIVDRHGKPIPWYSYPMIEFLSRRDFRGARVLEFGGGHSTLWWLERGAEVVTIEEDGEWADWVRTRTAGSKGEVHHIPCDRESRDMSAVASLLSERGAFDIVVIDGHLREEAAALAAGLLAPGGAMILDNADSADYDFSEVLARPGCRRVDFTGETPNGHKPTTSTLLYWGACRFFAPSRV